LFLGAAAVDAVVSWIGLGLAVYVVRYLTQLQEDARGRANPEALQAIFE
jgi:hypothetical protein